MARSVCLYLYVVALEGEAIFSVCRALVLRLARVIQPVGVEQGF